MKDIVLIPGAWLGGWVWNKITPDLEEKGYKVHPITLTGMGERSHLISKNLSLETAIKDVLNVIEFDDLDDFVLVGHSFAGKVAAKVADSVPEKVSMLIYLDAFIPEKTRSPQGEFDPASEFGPLPQGSLTIPLTDKIIDSIGGDVIAENRKWMLAKSTPWPIKYALDSIALSEKFDNIKSSYIFCTQGGDSADEIVSGKWGSLDGPYRIIESGHWPMITKPDELARDLIELTT